MKLKRIGIVTCITLFTLVSRAGAGEYWVTPDTSYGADGTGSGTAASPWVRSTAGTFDLLMDSATIPANSTIHLMAGTFHTITGFAMQPGWKIRGAGMDSTTIRLDPVTTPIVNNCIIGRESWYLTFGVRHNLEVSDLTVDINLQNQTQPLSYGAVRISGNNARISRIKVKNWGSKDGAEAFPLGISSHFSNNEILTNCVIEGCIIDQAAQVNHTQGATALWIAGQPLDPGPFTETPGAGWIAGAEIRDCLIKNVRASGSGGLGKLLYFNGMNLANVDGGKIAGNKCIDIDGGNCVWSSCGSLFNYVCENNLFLDVSIGINFAGDDYCPESLSANPGSSRFAKENLEFRNNTITLRAGGSAFGLAGYCVYGCGGSPVFRPMTNLLFRENSVRASSPSAIGSGITLVGARNATLEDNMVESKGGPEITYATDIPNGFVTFSSLKNNTAPDGRTLNVTEGGNPDGVDQEVVFTPSAPGWYRLTQYQWARSTANVKISRDLDLADNSLSDLIFEYVVRAYTSDADFLGHITLLRCNDYGAGQAVTKLRIGNNDPGGIETFVDIFVASAPAGRPIKVKVTNGRSTQFTKNPIYLGNPGTPPATQKTLDVGRALRTTGNFFAGGTITAGSANTQVTDSSGKVLSGALNDNVVTDAKLRDGIETSVIGRSANSTGDPADIQATADGQYLRRVSGVLGFGTIAAGELPAHTHPAADIISGLIATARLGGGTADNAKFLRGDQTWADALQEAAEASSTPVTDTASTAVGVATLRLFDFVTLPTTEKLYVITGIEWKNGATVAGNTICGAVLVDASPPTQAAVPTVAFGQLVANAGANSIQRVSRIVSQPIRGGTTIGIFVQASSTTHTYRTATVGSANNRKTVAAFPTGGDVAAQENAAWTASTTKAYIKVYYRGYR